MLLNDYAYIPFCDLNENDFKAAYMTTENDPDNKLLVLVTKKRMDNSSLPFGYHAYDILKGNNDNPIAISKNIDNSRFGTIIVKQLFPGLANDILKIESFKFANKKVTKDFYKEISDIYKSAKKHF